MDKGKGKKRVFYYHIPKAAGSTVENIVFDQYGFKDVYRFHSVRESRITQVQKLNHNSLAQYKAAVAIGEYGLHQLFKGSWHPFTILREPISRITSHYNFVKNTPDHFFYAKAQKLSFEGYLNEYPTIEMDNGQTRLLAGLDLNYEVDDYQLTTNEDLLKAQDHLENQFAAFGIMEQFDLSLVHFAKVFNWKFPVYQKKNVFRKAKEKPGTSTKSLIKQKNQLDIELYEFANSLFQRRIKSRYITYGLNLKVFTLLNKQLNEKGRKISLTPF